MDYKKLIPKIFQKIKKSPRSFEAYNDLFTICRSMESENHKMAHETNTELRRYIVKGLKRCHHQDAENFYSLYKKSLLFDAPHIFDAYLLYLEINRKPEERFYQPRRKVLKEVTDALQALTDDELDELFISMPPRVGKTSILMFYVTWLIGKNSEASNLYSAYSDTITKAFYAGVLEIINDPVTYLWADVFPEAKIAQTNAADETINIDRKKRYPSLTCRSLYGTLNGACDCNGVLISDDLIGGIEEALNKDRLISAWSKVDNNLLPRAKEKAKILWCGTRWSMIDPAGLRMELLQNDERFKNRRVKYINLSALDENDESQFDYDYGVGFSTEFYQQRRAWLSIWVSLSSVRVRCLPRTNSDTLTVNSRMVNPTASLWRLTRRSAVETLWHHPSATSTVRTFSFPPWYMTMEIRKSLNRSSPTRSSDTRFRQCRSRQTNRPRVTKRV